jgi:hypothetical protein
MSPAGTIRGCRPGGPAASRHSGGALREFVKRIGVAKANSTVDLGMFDFVVREVLNRPRRAAWPCSIR